ncbi:MAG: hypothetical protein IKH15_09200 [Bacteroidales bacterium]|nr:hypothetical protein [Bacteroidales bacterium]
MEKLNKLIFDGEEYLPKKVLLKWIREISDAVNSFSDRADPIRAQGANKVTSLLLEKIEPPQEHWKPSEEQMEELNKVRTLNPGLDALYQQLKNM